MNRRASSAGSALAVLLLVAAGCRVDPATTPTSDPSADRAAASSSSTSTDASRHEFVELVMAAPARFVLVHPDADTARRAARAALDRMHVLELVMSDWTERSELARLERLPRGRWHAVSPDLHAALARATRLAEETDGAFDPTVGALVRAWRPLLRGDTATDRPSIETLARAAASVDHRRLRVDANEPRARLDGFDTRLDLGGIGKGIAADEAARVLRGHGIDAFLIDFGGDLLLGDAPPGRAGWTVARTDATASVDANAAIATSGDRHQFVEIDGRRYAHIVDPRTGEPLAARVEVTVRARTATDADALASAIAVLAAAGETDRIDALVRADRARTATVRWFDDDGAPTRSRRFPAE